MVMKTRKLEKGVKMRSSEERNTRRDTTIPVPPEGMDTILALVEICESVEQSYRTALLAGETHPRVARSTNY